MCNFDYEKMQKNFWVFYSIEPSHKKTFQRPWDIFFRNFIVGLLLKYCSTACNQKLAYLKTSIPSEAEISTKCNPVKSDINPSCFTNQIFGISVKPSSSKWKGFREKV